MAGGDRRLGFAGVPRQCGSGPRSDPQATISGAKRKGSSRWVSPRFESSEDGVSEACRCCPAATHGRSSGSGRCRASPGAGSLARLRRRSARGVPRVRVGRESPAAKKSGGAVSSPGWGSLRGGAVWWWCCEAEVAAAGWGRSGVWLRCQLKAGGDPGEACPGDGCVRGFRA